MRPRLNSNAGMTLSEIMVATALGGLFLLVVGSMFSTDARYHSRVKGAEKIQEAKIALMKKILPEWKNGISGVADQKLIKCYLDSCSNDCRHETDWTPLSYQNIPLHLYRPNIYSPLINDGGYFKDLSAEACLPLAREIGEREDAKPRYPAACRYNAKADWKISKQGTVEIRIQFALESANLVHTVFHQFTPGVDHISESCIARKSNYCHGSGAYLLEIDPGKSNMVCGSTESELNYDFN